MKNQGTALGAVEGDQVKSGVVDVDWMCNHDGDDVHSIQDARKCDSNEGDIDTNHQVVILKVKEARLRCRRGQTTLRAIGATEMMAMASNWMGWKARWMMQQVVHAVTQNKLIQDHSLKTEQISTDATSAQQTTYLGHPHVPGSTMDVLPTI